MTSNRMPGRYNLHRLGWSAFEDLCMQVMRVVLGETCTRFRPGPDGGRDGWFQGQAAGLLSAHNQLAGNFVVQCKHTSTQHSALDKTDLRKEMETVQKIAAKTPCHYILMTNRQVSAQSEVAVRDAVEAINGVGRCLVLSESWIEDTVDAHPRLLRLVPRLYGIGDLSQILSSVIQQQTIAIFEDIVPSLRTFVPTDSYRRAEQAHHDHGFVMLVGPPASGKTAIAANLCMVSMAQDPDVRVLRIEHADQFKNTWSPADTHTIYWVDDVFGETTLDDDLLKGWSAALGKVEAARKRGARIIFCTRDYILAAAEQRLKQAKVDVFNDARIRVDVNSLSEAERDAILYNHIKDGDISNRQKLSLKKHLPGLARLNSFSPELARRLGNRRFHQRSLNTWSELQAFFDKPVAHFCDVIHGLSGSDTAALTVCLLSSNAVPDPVPDDALTEAVLKTYGVSMQQIRASFETLEGSLVSRVRSATTQFWRLHHPSMIEALQEELVKKSSHLVLYLQSARMSAILRDTTMLPRDADRHVTPVGHLLEGFYSRLVFLPATVYKHLVNRFSSTAKSELDAIACYLAERASDEFILAMEAGCPELLNRALAVVPEPGGARGAPYLAVRLSCVCGANLFPDTRREIVVQALTRAVEDTGWASFLEVEGIQKAIPHFYNEFLKNEVSNGFRSMGRLYSWHAHDLSSIDHVNSASDDLSAQAAWIDRALQEADLNSHSAKSALTWIIAGFDDSLEESMSKIVEEEEYEAALAEAYGEPEESWQEERHELEHGRFADVDE